MHLLEGGEGPPLVYLHGAGGAGGWGTFHDLLAKRFHVYAPAHPGFGLSDDLDDLQQVDDLALHTLDLLDLLGLERVALVGSSLGGWIAAELAVWHADRLSALVLIDAAGLNAPGVHEMRTIDVQTLIDNGTIVFGSPKTVRERLARFQQEMGFGKLLPLLNFGSLPADLTRKNMELFASEVMPALRQLGMAAQ